MAMIARLRGMLVEKAADRIVVDIQGVGYDVAIPFSTYYEIGEAGSEVALYVYTHVREDALQLFGFHTKKEKQIFLELIQISGIGPRLAVTILSGLPVDELLRAIVDGDVARLCSIPGVGRKTADRIVLELKGRLGGLLEKPEAAWAGGLQGDSMAHDVSSALINLGYPRPKAEGTVSRLLREKSWENFEELLKSALRELAG